MAVKSKLNPGANTGMSSYAQSDKTLRQLKATSQGISSIVDNFKQEEQQPASMPATTEPAIAKSVHHLKNIFFFFKLLYYILSSWPTERYLLIFCFS